MYTEDTEKTIQARRRRTRDFVLISLLIHLLLVLGWAVSESMVGHEKKEPLLAEVEPVDEPQVAFELVEVPDDAPRQEPDALSNLLSDREARAADLNPEQTPDLQDPFYDSDVDITQFERAETDPSEAQMEKSEQREDEDVLAENALPLLELDFADEMTSKPGQEYSREAESPENLQSSSVNKGSISFNTYDWDFAPYMLAMKRAVERHLYPPYAFTHMGLVSGDNLIRFVVSPDGTIRDLRILDSNAHYSLDRASVRAIEAAAPFLPLPRNFPEEYLEVTAHFSYTIRGESARR
jgi:TonB family protein